MSPLNERDHSPFSLLPVLGAALFVVAVLLPARFTTVQTQAFAEAQSQAIYLPLTVSSGFGIIPVGQEFNIVTGISHAGDDRIFITEKGGRIRILHPDGRATTFIDLTSRVVSSDGEYGLYDIAFHPGYAAPGSPGRGFFYVFYTGREGNDTYSYISRFRVSADPDAADPTSETRLFRLRQTSIYHKGGGLEFDPRDATLYAAVGDDRYAPNAQMLDTPKGKIIRLRVDNIPATAVGDVSDQVEPELVATGLRNPYRIDLDPQSNRLFIGDVGESTWEEINVVALGDTLPNLAWPCREGPEPFALYQDHPECAGNKTFSDPATYLSHGDGRCAVIAGIFTRVEDSAGEFIYGDACSHEIFSMKSVGGIWSSNTLGKVPMGGLLTTIAEDVHGNLYIGSTRPNGPIYRLILR